MRLIAPRLLALLASALTAALALGFWLTSEVYKPSKGLTTGDGHWFQALGTKLVSTTHNTLPPSNLQDFGVVVGPLGEPTRFFTLNHSSPDSLLVAELRGDSEGKPQYLLRDISDSTGYAQNPQFPTFVDSSRGAPPRPGDPAGLYIYRRDGPERIEFRFHAVEERVEALIQLVVPFAQEVIVEGDVSVVETVPAHFTGETVSALRNVERVRVSGGGGGSLTLRMTPFRVNAVPVDISLAPVTDLSSVFIGPDRQHPNTHQFSLYRRDRHGALWTDLNGDNRADLVITRGGMRGLLAEHPGAVSDELLLTTPSGEFISAEHTFDKRGCPGRQISSADIDGDGSVEIFVSCGRTAGPTRNYPDQLFSRSGAGRFNDIAERVGLATPELATVAWFDADSDGDLDCLRAEEGRLALMRNEAGKFSLEIIHAFGESPIKARRIAVADYDNDQDTDALVVAGSQSTLLVNDGTGRFELIAPRTVGLPTAPETAIWVDLDNDGWQDLHSLPEGLFQQERPGRFSRTGLLEATPMRLYWRASSISALLDIDGDGRIDLVNTTLFGRNRRVKPLLEWSGQPSGTITSYRNVLTDAGHWLHVDVLGPPGDVFAAGTTISISTSAGTQTRVVGQSDGSHFSLGHYRVYFGLGWAEEVEALTAVWPDSTTTTVERPQVDRVVLVAHPSRLDP